MHFDQRLPQFGRPHAQAVPMTPEPLWKLIAMTTIAGCMLMYPIVRLGHQYCAFGLCRSMQHYTLHITLRHLWALYKYVHRSFS